MYKKCGCSAVYRNFNILVNLIIFNSCLYIAKVRFPTSIYKNEKIIITMANEKKTQSSVEEPKKTLFFGWTNIKWFFKEIMNVYSSKPSYFSKKRLESGVAFIIAQWGMIFFLLQKYQTLTMGEFLLWAAAEFAVSGYIINKIQKEKESQSTDETN